jgi:hypothetical protein
MVNNFFAMHRVSIHEREFDPICVAVFYVPGHRGQMELLHDALNILHRAQHSIMFKASPARLVSL